MVSEPGKIEDFDNLNDDSDVDDRVGKDPAEETADGLADSESSPVKETDLQQANETEETEEAEEVEDLEEVDEAPEMMFAKDEQELQQEEVLVKYCMFCREVIPAEAIACKFCGHVLHIFEGNVFKQLYWFFWGAVITLVGTFLPYYSGELTLVTACTTFTGSLFLIFSLLLLAAMTFSIYSKRLLMSPVFLMFIPAIVTWWTLVKRVGVAPEDYAFYQFFYDIDAINWLANDVGAGLLLIMLGSTIVALTFVVSLFTAILGGGKDKAPEKVARGGARARGRRR